MINLISESTFTSGMLITDTVQAPGGSSDSIPTLTVDDDGNPVSAALEIQSTEGALLVPRMTTDEINDLNASNGMIVYDTDSDDFGIYQANAWKSIATGAATGDVVGPAGAVDGNIAIFDGNTGKLIADSGVSVALIPPPAVFASRASKSLAAAAPGDVIQIGNLGVVQFVGGIGLTFVDNFCPTTYYEDNGQVCTIVTGTTAAESGPTTPSCLFEIQSTTGAFVLPRMTTAERDALFATSGMMIYNTDIKQIEFFELNTWVELVGQTENVKTIDLSRSVYDVQDIDYTLSIEPNYIQNSIPIIKLPEIPVIGDNYKVLDGGGTAFENNIYINGNLTKINQTLLSVVGNSDPFHSTPTTGQFTPDGNCFYVVNSINNSVTFYYGVYSHTFVESSQVQVSEILVGTNPTSVVITPNGKYAYVSNLMSNNITVIQNASTNNPTVLMTIPSVGGTKLAITPNGEYVYSLSGVSSVYVIKGASSGAPSLMTTLTAGVGAVAITISNNGNYAYVANFTSNNVTVIQNASTTTPTVLTTLITGVGPSEVAITPNGKYAYITNYTSSNCTVIQNASTATPTVLTTVALSSVPVDIKITPDGNYAYIPTTANTVKVLQGVSTNSPSVLKTITVGTLPSKLTITPNGNYVYVANQSSNNVTVIKNAQTTNPIVIATSSVGATPSSISVSPNGRYVYVICNTSGASLFVIKNASNGLPDYPYISTNLSITGSSLTQITPDGNYAYVSTDANTVAVIKNVSSETPSILTSALGSIDAPYTMAISPNGNYVYVASFTTNQIDVIQNASTDTPTVLTSLAASGSGCQDVKFTPDGNYVYLTDSGADSVVVVQNASTSFPSVLTSISVGTTPTYMAITPNGNYAYVCNSNSGHVSIIKNASTNSPSVLTTISTGTLTYDVAITPDGNYAYVTSTGDNLVSVIENASSDSPTLLTTISVNRASIVKITPDGNYVYILAGGGSSVITVIQGASTQTPSILTSFSGAGINGSALNITPDGYYAIAGSIGGSNPRIRIIKGASSGSPVLSNSLGPFNVSGITSTPNSNKIYASGLNDIANTQVLIMNTDRNYPLITENYGSGTLTFDGNIWIASPGV